MATRFDEADPTVSAVVELHPQAGPGEEGLDFEAHQREKAKVKAHFTSAGFEVHAPFASSFSIGARLSHFEEYFGDRIVLEREGLATTATVEGGGRELSLDRVPDDAKIIVKGIHFVPPPDWFPGSA